MNSQTEDFARGITSISPELTDVYRQHISDEGGLLPHVLMGEITRLVIASVDREQPDWLHKLLQHLESGLISGDNEIAELIGVSFVENLSGEDRIIQVLAPLMGEALRREVKSICGV